MAAHTPHQHRSHLPTAQGFEELTFGIMLFAGASVAAAILLLLIVI